MQMSFLQITRRWCCSPMLLKGITSTERNLSNISYAILLYMQKLHNIEDWEQIPLRFGWIAPGVMVYSSSWMRVWGTVPQGPMCLCDWWLVQLCTIDQLLHVDVLSPPLYPLQRASDPLTRGHSAGWTVNQQLCDPCSPQAEEISRWLF